MSLADPLESGRPLQALLTHRAAQGNFDHYYEGVEIAFDAGRNLAHVADGPTVSPRLAAHSRRMAQRIYRVAERVYSAVGYALANVIFVVGDDALIVIDTTESKEGGEAAWADFRKAAPHANALPVRAVVYTHNHSDHIGGVRAFADEARVKSGETWIIAHASLMEVVVNNAALVGPILSTRSAYSFGALLPVAAEGNVNAGIGPILARGKSTFLAPTHTFKDRWDVTLAGVRFEFIYAPSEADDEIIACLPDLKVLLSAEVIQGECFANVHTIRGTRYRDPVQWVRTIDMMRELVERGSARVTTGAADAHAGAVLENAAPASRSARAVDFMVPAHGRPVAGNANIAELLTAYRDAIAFTHDQAVRFINKGYTPDELAETLPALPPHLAAHAWLGEYYGTVKHSVRQVFSGQLGWFDGDPATLDPLPRAERARRLVALMGGTARVQTEAQAALDGGDARWAAELASYLVRIDTKDAAAKQLKAAALRVMGFASDNVNWRNWMLTAAHELEGKYEQLPYRGGAGFASEDILAGLPLDSLLQFLAVRVAAERCIDAHHIIALHFTPDQTTFVLELRRGVMQVHAPAAGSSGDCAAASVPSGDCAAASVPSGDCAAASVSTALLERVSATLSLTRAAFIALGRGTPFMELAAQGAVQVTHGKAQALADFFLCLDPQPKHPPKLASR